MTYSQLPTPNSDRHRLFGDVDVFEGTPFPKSAYLLAAKEEYFDRTANEILYFLGKYALAFPKDARWEEQASFYQQLLGKFFAHDSSSDATVSILPHRLPFSRRFPAARDEVSLRPALGTIRELRSLSLGFGISPITTEGLVLAYPRRSGNCFIPKVQILRRQRTLQNRFRSTGYNFFLAHNNIDAASLQAGMIPAEIDPDNPDSHTVTTASVVLTKLTRGTDPRVTQLFISLDSTSGETVNIASTRRSLAMHRLDDARRLQSFFDSD